MDGEDPRRYAGNSYEAWHTGSARRPELAALVATLLLLVGAPVRAQVSNYIVGPQDVLAIALFDQQDLSGKYTVEADGTFTFPLIGRVKAGGLTLRSVEEALRKELSNGFFKNPQVSGKRSEEHTSELQSR